MRTVPQKNKEYKKDLNCLNENLLNIQGVTTVPSVLNRGKLRDGLLTHEQLTYSLDPCVCEMEQKALH